jgi:hypothetical protein
MQQSDVTLLAKKILVGVVVTVAPLLIISSLLWLVQISFKFPH